MKPTFRRLMADIKCRCTSSYRLLASVLAAVLVAGCASPAQLYRPPARFVNPYLPAAVPMPAPQQWREPAARPWAAENERSERCFQRGAASQRYEKHVLAGVCGRLDDRAWPESAAQPNGWSSY